MRTKWFSGIAGTVAAGAVVLAVGAGVATAESFHRTLPMKFPQQPSTGQCEASYAIACYDAAQLRHAYGVDVLAANGLNGAGTTIVLVDPYGSPTIRGDLQTFDQDNHLPAPPSLQVISPAGAPPTWDPTLYPDQPGWAGETTLDVEVSHAIAPAANILLVTTPVDETEGVQGFPQIVQAENYVIDHHLGDVISQSFGATEETFQDANGNFDPSLILGLRSAYENAAANGVTVLDASGDAGATDVDLSGDYYPFPVIDWPSSDPLVTSVGGTQLHLDAAGNRIAPDNVWNDTYNTNVNTYLGEPTPSPLAGSGGVSAVFSRPAYQDSVQRIVGGQRGTPDVSLSAAVDGGVNLYESFPGVPGSWQVAGGTSEAAPLFAGVVAIADQIAGHPLGLLNPSLYRLGDSSGPGVTDITAGNNTVSFVNASNAITTVKGYAAAPGYDLAGGLGSPNVALPFQLAALSR